MLLFSFLLYSNQHAIIRVEFRHASSNIDDSRVNYGGNVPAVSSRSGHLPSLQVLCLQGLMATGFERHLNRHQANYAPVCSVQN